MRIRDVIPTAENFLSLEIEEVAGVLLLYLNSLKGQDNPISRKGCINQHNLFNQWSRDPEYPTDAEAVRRVLLEAWRWLERSDFLVADVDTVDATYFISRRGETVASREDFNAYRRASLLTRAQIHPLIASRVYPAFLRGEYDTAVFQAFREIEVAVRTAAQLPTDLIGDKLMRAAFKPAESSGVAGPLADTRIPAAEQLNMAHMFAGTFGVYRNSTAHRHVPTDPNEAAEVIMFASALLRIVDRLNQGHDRLKGSMSRESNG